MQGNSESLAKPDSWWVWYASEFEARRSDDIRLLELGVAEADSLRRWLDFLRQRPHRRDRPQHPYRVARAVGPTSSLSRKPG